MLRRKASTASKPGQGEATAAEVERVGLQLAGGARFYHHRFHASCGTGRFALFAFASFARAESLRVVAPANGATLRGGSFAELRWTSAQLPPKARSGKRFCRWMVGSTTPSAVTHHLDIQLRSFTFVVPNVDTRNARILIRTGDEVHELHFESRDSFSIVRDAKAEQPLPRLVRSRDAAKRRATAIPRSWRGRDGDRNGSGVTRQSSTPASSAALTRRLGGRRHGDVPVARPLGECLRCS